MRILVVGDFCYDFFIYGSVPKLSAESPTVVFHPHKVKTNAGMAGNVYENVKSLRQGWDITMAKPNNNTKKTRYVDEKSGYILFRVDENDFCNESYQAPPLNELRDYDAVVVSDYGKGFLTESQLQDLFARCHILKIPTFMDTKKQLGNWSRYCFCVKINKTEFDQLKGVCCQNLVVTMGREGASLFEVDEENLEEIFTDPVPPVAVRNVAGAGDSFLAGLVVRFLEKKSLTEAIRYANKVGSIAVSKLGVVAIKEEEVLKEEEEVL